MSNQFTRIKRIIGEKGFEKLQNSFVVVVGLGAVGSYATEALTRAGVGKLRLVDFDSISESNLNRQLYALNSTIGQDKAAVAEHRVRDINPSCQVEALKSFVHVETMDTVLADNPDMVIDAIDSLNPKLELIAAARTGGIPIVSSMGAALRTDPTKIRVAKLSKTRHCPLARVIRKRLRRRKIPTDSLCVYSLELPHKLPEYAIGRDEHSEHFDGRKGRKRNVLGSLPTLTGIFGLTVANTALDLLLDGILPKDR